MTQDLLLVSASVCLIALTTLLLVLFVRLSKGLTAMGVALRGLEQELTPLLRDLRAISLNVVVASESMNKGLDGLHRLGGALGNIGDDLEAGRRLVKTSVLLAAGFWQSKWKFFGRMLAERSKAGREKADEHLEMR